MVGNVTPQFAEADDVKLRSNDIDGKICTEGYQVDSQVVK